MKRNLGATKLSALGAILLSLLTSFPILHGHLNLMILIIGSLFIYTLFFRRPVWEDVFILFLVIVLVTYIHAGHSSASVGRYYLLAAFFQGIFVFRLLENTSRLEVFYTSFLFFVFLATFLQNVFLYANPGFAYIANFVDRSSVEYSEIYGGTIYLFVSIVSTYIVLRDPGRAWIKALYFTNCFVYVILSMKFSGYLLFFLMSVLLIAVSYSLLRSVLILVLLVIAVTTITKTLDQNSLSELVPIFQRIDAVVDLLLRGETSAETSRLDLAMLSIQSFINNPYLGLGYDYHTFENGIDGVKQTGIGHHSELIDVLARLGFIGIAYNCFVIYKMTKPTLRKLIITKDTFSVVILFLFWGLINNYTSVPSGMLVFVIVPFFLRTMLHRNYASPIQKE